MTEPTNPRPLSSMRLRYGVNRVLEEEADALIYAEVRKIKRHSDNNILTPWKEKDRRSHEVYVPSGVPDAANRLGVYHRAFNPDSPHLNSREGVARGLSRRVPRDSSHDNSNFEYERGPNVRNPNEAGRDGLQAFVRNAFIDGWEEE